MAWRRASAAREGRQPSRPLHDWCPGVRTASGSRKDIEFGTRLFDRGAVAKAPEDAQHARVATTNVGIEAERHPDLRRAWPHGRRMESFWQHADQRVRPAAQKNGLSQQPRDRPDSGASRVRG